MKITALLDALNSALAEPFALAWSQDSPRFLLVFTVIYAVVVIVAVTDQKNTRPGAEHGSAAWGDVFRLNKFYMDRHGSNLLLTQHFHIGIDGYKHKHNTNILIVGGSGAGKTRTYGVPNVLECACSMVITDPKSEILRKTGNLLKQKGYEVIVFDLINPAASFCYNPFVYVHDDREVLTLIENLIQNTTPSHSKSSDPFWEKSETALLQALMLYLLHEAPPEEQNFSMVMEKKGIRTEKGEFNRWIKATNAVIRDIKKKIALLFDWIAEAKAELAKPQAPDLVSLLNAYYTQRRAGAYSQKGKISNLKEMNETFNYLRRNGIYSLEDLEHRVSEHSAATESLKKTLDEQTARMKAIKRLYDSSAAFQNLKPVYDGLQKIKLEKPRAKYKAEHEAELIQFYAARRKLTGEFPDGKVDMKKLSDEYDELEQAHNTTYGEFKTVRDDLHRLWKVKSCVDTAARFNERTEEQKLQNRPQTRQKKEDMTR